MPIVRLDSTDPYLNLAIEERALSESGNADEPTLLLWISDPAIVIGRHQNPWQECRPRHLDDANILLARRISGGGAVYHDHGNLNISFIASSDIYDQTRQFDIVIRALASLGVAAAHTNRNDIVVNHNGRPLKISGSAFRHTRGRSLHHATLLVTADLDALRTSLTPAFTGISSAAIQSVRSSVCNLSELHPGLTVDEVSAAVSSCFAMEYATKHSNEHTGTDSPLVAPRRWPTDADLVGRRNELARWEWIYGRTPPFTARFDDVPGFGAVTLTVRKAVVVDVAVGPSAGGATDTALFRHLVGRRFDSGAFRDLTRGIDDDAVRLAVLFLAEEIA